MKLPTIFGNSKKIKRNFFFLFLDSNKLYPFLKVNISRTVVADKWLEQKLKNIFRQKKNKLNC